mgnify:CR=1 FL=1
MPVAWFLIALLEKNFGANNLKKKPRCESDGAFLW